MGSSSVSSLNNLSLLRVNGLATGIDTESLVQQLMAAQRAPLDRLKQQRQTLEWTQEAYRTMNTTLLNFRNAAASMRLQSSFLINKVSSSNESVATATASGSAIGSVFDINVTQLASAAKAISSNGISNEKYVLTGQAITAPVAIDESSNSFKLKVGNETYDVSLDNGNYTAEELAGAINDKISGSGVTAFVASDGKLQFVSDSQFELLPATENDALSKLGFDVAADSSAKAVLKGIDLNESIDLMIKEGRLNGPSGGYGTNLSFAITTYNQDGTPLSKQFTFDATKQSLQDIINTVQKAGIGLSGFYDEASDKVMFTSKYTGKTNANGAGIEFSDSTGFISSTLNLAVTDGQNAKFTINGLETERKSNTFVINSVTFTLKSAGASTISIQQDTDAIVTKIKDFVNQYNDILDKINTALTEKRYRDYQPLTDEQKEAMTDKQIEQWEEKAKSGLLKSDSLLYKTFYDLRNAITTPVQGTTGDLNSLSKIGITTGLWYENGHLYIDETKLSEAVANDPDGVMQLFTKTSTSTDKTQAFNESGIAQRLYTVLGNAIDSITQKAGSTSSLVDNSMLGLRMRDIDTRITDMQDRLNDIENRYYQQFAAMEEAINNMNAQSAWLSQQLSVLSGK